MNVTLLRRLALPAMVLVLGGYFIGLRVYQNRHEIVQAPEIVLQETEAPEFSQDSSGVISLNTATKEDLMELEHIGEVLAERILQKREELGEFTGIEQLLTVDGIGETLYESLKTQVTL